MEPIDPRTAPSSGGDQDVPAFIVADESDGDQLLGRLREPHLDGPDACLSDAPRGELNTRQAPLE